MSEYIAIGIIIAFPIALGILLRVNASHLFFSVMAGELLARYFGEDAEMAIHTMFHNESLIAYSHLFIMTLPVVLTAIVLKNSVPRTRVVINIGPLIVTGLVYAAFAIPLLPPDVQSQITKTALGQEFVNSTSALIGFVVLFQLVVLWLTERGDPSKKKRRKKD